MEAKVMIVAELLKECNTVLDVVEEYVLGYLRCTLGYLPDIDEMISDELYIDVFNSILADERPEDYISLSKTCVTMDMSDVLVLKEIAWNAINLVEVKTRDIGEPFFKYANSHYEELVKLEELLSNKIQANLLD